MPLFSLNVGGFAMEDCFVFFDGGYLSKIAKSFGFGKGKKYDLYKFAINISKEKKWFCKRVYYYTAPPYQNQTPTHEQNERKKRYDKFINKIKKINNLIIREGRCQKTNEGYQQKGVDTLITMDLSSISSKEEVKNFIVLLCDTDFVPILNHIRKENKIKVILAYYFDFKRKSEFSMSNHILTACDDKIKVQEKHFKDAILEENNKS